MKPEDRQDKILSLLRALRIELRDEDLAEMLAVSALTIRRDLQKLSRDRLILRTHGGCMAVGRAAFETEYHRKVALNFELKKAIGFSAAGEIHPGETILINGGSTTFHLASHLGNGGPLTVFTNSIAMIAELGRYRDISLFILGGQYNDGLHSLSGGFTERILEQFYFDTVFLGVDAVDEQGACTVNSIEEARLTQVMLHRAKKKILLADHTKAGKIGHYSLWNLNDVDLWVTTPGMDTELSRLFHKKTSIREAKQ